MRISRWGSVSAVVGIALSSLAFAAPIAIEASIEGFISEIKSTLPQGSVFEYEGLEYSPLKDEVYFEKAQISWAENQNTNYSGGDVTFTKITLNESNGGVANWLASVGNERSSTKFSLSWDGVDLNLIEPEYTMSGSKGEATGIKIPDLQSLRGMAISEIIMNQLSIENVAIESTNLSYQKVLSELGPVEVDGQTGKLTISEYSAGILNELDIDNFMIETIATNRFGDKVDLKLRSENNKLQELNILPIFRNLANKDYNYAHLWQSDLETFEEFRSIMVELDGAKSDLSEFGGIQSKNIELEVVVNDTHTLVKVAEAIAHKSNDLVSDGIFIRNIGVVTNFSNEPTAEIKNNFDEIYSKKLDISQVPIHIEKLLRAGALVMQQRFDEEGFLSIMPSMYFEEIGFKGAHLNIHAQKNDDVKVNQFKVFDISIDDNKNLSFGINVEGAATRKNTVRMFAPDLYALLGVVKGDHVLLSANLDVDQITPKDQIRLNDFSLSVEELGGVSFKADLGNLNVNNFETFNPMGGMINSLAFHVRDRGVVEAGKLIFALAQQWPVEQTDGLLVGIVSSQRKEGQSIRTNRFFDSLEAILTSAGDFHVKGNPANPVEFINIMGLLGASDIDGLVNKLELESEFSPLSAN